MNTYTLIPLIATIAYLPLLVILFFNRPWQRKQRLFFLFLLLAILWSFSDFLSRGDFLTLDKLIEVKVILCISIAMGVQFHYFLRYFYQPQRGRMPLGYFLVIGTVALAALGYVPQSVDITTGGTHVSYGIWFMLAGLLVLILGGRDVYFLTVRRRIVADPAQRNQIAYLFVGIAALLIFVFISFAPFGGAYPFAHIGNLLNACVLGYAVVAHKLLDVKIVLRQATLYLGIYAVGVAAIVLCLFLAHLILDFNVDFPTFGLVIGVGVPLTFFFFHRVREPWQRKIEKAFVRDKYNPRRQLSDFVTKIHNVPTLAQFGQQLVSLLSQSTDCQRACLLLPEGKGGDFISRFAYPPAENNLMAGLSLRPDSPAVAWLKREGKTLPRRNMNILPEFQSLWQEEREDIQSAKVQMLVPIVNRDELVAILAMGNRLDDRLYSVEDIDLMESIAGRVAASMEKEYLHEQLQEQDEELTLINHLTTIIISSANIEEIFEGFTQELKQMLAVDYASIALIEGDQLRVLALSAQVSSVRQVGQGISLRGTTTEWVAEHRKTLYEADVKEHSRFWTAAHYIDEGIRSLIHLPLLVRDEVIGSLIIGSQRPNAYSPKQIQRLERLASQIATPIENSQFYARAEQRSRIDELTGLFNRRHFEEKLKEEIARHSRHSNVLSLLMLDLDSFKAYNDMYGHPSGDRLLNQIGAIVNSSIRDADEAFRYGGDEFVVILPETDAGDAHLVAERVRECIAAEMEAKQIPVTCSIGLASYPADGVMPSELVNTADTALYYAKNTGGNRTYLSSKIFSELGTQIEANARGGGLSAVYALAAAVDAKDHYTYGHSKKVNTYAVALAEQIGLPPDEVSRISTAALLHDIGKIGIPDRILNKKGKISLEEWDAIKSHPRLGANIVGNVPDLAPCVGNILYHHERWDGAGYPEGLKGRAIPLGARILAVADAFAAMTSARPYRDAFCDEKVLRKLREGAGNQFDPELVEVFIGLIQAGPPRKAQVGTGSPSEQPSP